MTNVVLIYKKGGDFRISDVVLLATNLAKRSDVHVYCFTDAIIQSYELIDLTLIPLPTAWDGWWSKLNLFSPELENLRPFLFMDLDTAVVGSIDSLVVEIDQTKLITLEDFYRKGVLASGVMWIPKDSEKVKKVWENWIVNPKANISRFKGDMQFIGSIIAADEFFQNFTLKIGSFKPIAGKGWLKELPAEKSVICFHGQPRIPKAAETVEWVHKYMNDEL
jgi:hypothetical protein